jgi:hypothetical protein
MPNSTWANRARAFLRNVAFRLPGRPLEWRRDLVAGYAFFGRQPIGGIAVSTAGEAMVMVGVELERRRQYSYAEIVTPAGARNLA